jgi:hypothetical protein
MGFSKLQVNWFTHKKSYGFWLITLKVVNWQEQKNAHFYEHKIHPTWTHVEPIFKDIQIGSNSTDTITRMQFPIQLIATRTMHWAQWLRFNHLAFDPNGVYKHGFTYTTIFCIKNK